MIKGGFVDEASRAWIPKVDLFKFLTKYDIEEIGFGFYGRHVETWEMNGWFKSFRNLDDYWSKKKKRNLDDLWSVPELHKEKYKNVTSVRLWM